MPSDQNQASDPDPQTANDAFLANNQGFGGADWLGHALGRIGSVPTQDNPDIPTIEPQRLTPFGDVTQMYEQMKDLPHAVSQAWHNGIMPSADREQAYIENERNQNLERYRQDPEGFLEEAKGYVMYEPQDGPNRLAKEQYMQRLPLEVIDQIYRSQLQPETEAQNETVVNKTHGKISPFETRTEPSRAHGGSISAGTRALLAKLKSCA